MQTTAEIDEVAPRKVIALDPSLSVFTASMGGGEEIDAVEPAPSPTGVYDVTHDGFAVDPDTGEVIGMVNASGQLIEDKPEDKTFRVDSIGSAEWVLAKFLDSEQQIASEKQKLATIQANIAGRIKQEENKLAWLNARFGQELRAFAENELQGQKRRSVKTAFGTIGFRATQGSIKIANAIEALKWAEINAPDAIKVEKSILVSLLKGQEEKLPTSFFEVTGPSDKFYIATGVK